MIRKIFIVLSFLILITNSSVFAARNKTYEEHVNNELTFYKNVSSCTPSESAEPNFNTSRKIYGNENGTCHFVYRNNIDCHLPPEVAQKFSEVGLRIYNDYSDYGMITSTTADIKYLDKGVLYNSRYCRVINNQK